MEKVNKIYTCCHYDFDISLHFIFIMTPCAKYLDNISVYGFITQSVICFMVWPANPTKFCQHDRDMHFYLLRVPKLSKICISKKSYYRISVN